MSGRKPYIDTSTMETEAGRKLAGRINRNVETSDTQLDRLSQVLNEYYFYLHDFQLNLTDAAIVWAYAALASHDRRKECESNLHAPSDIMYTSTADGEKTLSESDRQQLVVAATAVQQHLEPGIGDILRESAQKLTTYKESNPLRITVGSLHLVRTLYLEHAAPRLLSNLTDYCITMCMVLEAYTLGIVSKTIIAEAMHDVIKTSQEISKSVHAAIDSGNLIVQDGVIVNPNNDPDAE
ncbi:MAG: hypothetical protein JKY95_05160 [Planctomycetaceae bacterium]|nr:hypothetical protein [Planctomycetaceae bacterium]